MRHTTEKKKNIHTHRCFCEDSSALPDYDIHNQHVSNQPHDTHYGVESGDDNRNDNGVGVVPQVAGQWAISVASHVREARGVVVGEVMTEAAGVVQHGQLVICVRAVACALHGSRCADCSCARLSPPHGCPFADLVPAIPRRVLVCRVLGEARCFSDRQPVTLNVTVLKNVAVCDVVSTDDPSRGTASLHGTGETAWK